MNIYFFPTLPFPYDGYSIAVCSDLKRLNPSPSDFVVWYNMDLLQKKVEYGHIIDGPSKYALQRFVNIAKGKLSCEMSLRDLKGLDLPPSPEKIFCGDIHFYRLLKELYPKSEITVRFHNCYSRIGQRIKLLGAYTPNLKFRINLRGNYYLEKEIFNDTLTKKIFISQEDCDFYTSMMGKYDDSVVWGLEPDFEKVKCNRQRVENPTKIVWFGGVQAHKADSLKWFIDDVFSKLRNEYPLLEFHLYGNGTQAFHHPDNNVFGHGRYEGGGMPYKSNGIYVNPDLTGGGVKIKLLQYFEEGLTFLTNPFGYEGYSYKWVDNEYCYCKQLDEWYDFLLKRFQNSIF